MKNDPDAFFKSYQAALRKRLAQSPASSRKASLGLGRGAVKLGLGTLDLATIHGEALVSLESTPKNGTTVRVRIPYRKVRSGRRASMSSAQ